MVIILCKTCSFFPGLFIFRSSRDSAVSFLFQENILLRQRGQSAIKVIDFGSSCYEHQKGISVNILSTSDIYSSSYSDWPYPSYLAPLFQNEFKLSVKTRFQTEVKGNPEMAHSYVVEAYFCVQKF